MILGSLLPSLQPVPPKNHVSLFHIYPGIIPCCVGMGCHPTTVSEVCTVTTPVSQMRKFILRGPVMLKVTQLVGVQLGFESRQSDSIVHSLWHQAKSLRRNILLKNKWNFSVALQIIWEEGFAFTSLCKTYCISFSQKLE